jgi:excisionase family DNA binding protein
MGMSSEGGGTRTGVVVQAPERYVPDRAVSKLLLTPEEAAEALSIGRSKLYELLANGSLESVAIGACRRIPNTALHDFVERLRESRRPSVAQGLTAS